MQSELGEHPSFSPAGAAPAVAGPSLLFAGPGAELVSRQPAYFPDLNLDQLIETITQGRDEYELGPFFHTRLRSPAEVSYRQEVFHELEREAARVPLLAFAERMRRVRRYLSLAKRVHYELEAQRWHLDAALEYTDALDEIGARLAALTLCSKGLSRINEFLHTYSGSDRYRSLKADAAETRVALSRVRYLMTIAGDRVVVRREEDEEDLGAEIAATFDRFRVTPYEASADGGVRYDGLSHVEAAVVELVSQLFTEEFSALRGFNREHQSFVDPVVARFDRESQFYFSYLELMERVRDAGPGFCYPHVSVRSDESFAADSFDLALADKLGGEAIVPNDFHLRGRERILVVTGPNQGGKTTFARMFGQLHHLAAIGCPTPGSAVSLPLCDGIFTHFERRERAGDFRGKLEQDLQRLHETISRCDERSVVILNESLTSTTVADARELGAALIDQLVQRGARGVYVTFIDELASRGAATVSMVSTVDDDDPALRTFEIARRPADGLAYAGAIAAKYALSYEALRERVAK